MQEDKLKALQTQLAQCQQEMAFIAAQLAMKEQQLQIILEEVPLILAAFSSDGVLELNTGRGTVLPDRQVNPSAYIGMSIYDPAFREAMPHISEAVEKVLSTGQTLRAKTWHSDWSGMYLGVFVPCFDSNQNIERVYVISYRYSIHDQAIPTDFEGFFKGERKDYTFDHIEKTD